MSILKFLLLYIYNVIILNPVKLFAISISLISWITAGKIPDEKISFDKVDDKFYQHAFGKLLSVSSFETYGRKTTNIESLRVLRSLSDYEPTVERRDRLVSKLLK